MTLPESTKFLHAYDICCGRGRIIYAPATTTTSDTYDPEARVLPGGRRTHNIAEARRMAEYIRDVSR